MKFSRTAFYQRTIPPAIFLLTCIPLTDSMMAFGGGWPRDGELEVQASSGTGSRKGNFALVMGNGRWFLRKGIAMFRKSARFLPHTREWPPAILAVLLVATAAWADYPTRIANLGSKEAVPGMNVLLEAELQYEVLPSQFRPLPGYQITFSYRKKVTSGPANPWIEVPDDGMAATSTTTSPPGAVGGEGIARTLFYLPEDLPLGDYEVQAVFDGQGTGYDSRTATADLTVANFGGLIPIRLRGGTPGIPLILVHGDGSDAQDRLPYCRWDTFIGHINNNPGYEDLARIIRENKPSGTPVAWIRAG